MGPTSQDTTPVRLLLVDDENHGIDLRDTLFSKSPVHFRKAGGVEAQGTATPTCKFSTHGKRIGIAIKCMNARAGSQDSLTISACTKGTIHND